MAFPAILQSVADAHRAILYRPEFNSITGSVTASILLNQIIFWAEQSKGTPFYKFLQPCAHEKYRHGDSWCEELGFSYRELQGAIAKIGTKIMKGTSKADVLCGESPQSLVLYWTDASRVTWWQLNVALAERVILEIYEANRQNVNYLSKFQNRNYLDNRQNGNYLQSDKREITYSSTENTTKKINKEGGGDHEKNEPATQDTILVVNPQDSGGSLEIKKEYTPPQSVVVTAKRTMDLGRLRGGRVSHQEIAVEHISAFKSVEEKQAFGEWAKTELQKDYSETHAWEKASWSVRNLDQNKIDDLFAVELLKRYRAISAKSEQQGASTSIVDRLIVLAKSNPLEAQKQANETERSKGLPQNFYWNKILGAL